MTKHYIGPDGSKFKAVIDLRRKALGEMCWTVWYTTKRVGTKRVVWEKARRYLRNKQSAVSFIESLMENRETYLNDNYLRRGYLVS